jgi:hypothetical protein
MKTMKAEKAFTVIGRKLDKEYKNSDLNIQIKNPGASSWVCFTNKVLFYVNNSNCLLSYIFSYNFLSTFSVITALLYFAGHTI